jgi:hypothetical protein
MPAWIAGIQAAGCVRTIHVDLGSGSPCRNDGVDKIVLTIKSE